MGHMLAVTGRQVLRLPAYVYAITLFMVRSLNPARQGRYRLNRASFHTFVSQVLFSGVDALPIMSLLALTAGAAMTSQAILTLQMVGERAEIIDLVVRVVVFEVGTILTAIVLLGRTGSAICVDLGNMKLNRELTGLEMLGINLNHFLVTPRILAAAVAQMVLAIYVAVLAIVAGIALLAWLQHGGYWSYLPAIALALHPFDLLIFLGKNRLFGLVIGGVACYRGFQVGQSRTELPQQTQQAIVYGLTLILIMNALFMVLVH